MKKNNGKMFVRAVAFSAAAAGLFGLMAGEAQAYGAWSAWANTGSAATCTAAAYVDSTTKANIAATTGYSEVTTDNPKILYAMAAVPSGADWAQTVAEGYPTYSNGSYPSENFTTYSTSLDTGSTTIGFNLTKSRCKTQAGVLL